MQSTTTHKNDLISRMDLHGAPGRISIHSLALLQFILLIGIWIISLIILIG